MATSGSKGGGFSIGVIYGLIVSSALYLVLVYLFPINTGFASVAPEVMQNAGGQIAAAESGSEQPGAADMAMAPMPQPDAGGASDIALGGAGDSSPASTTLVAPVTGNADVAAPAVETESAAVPDIGNGAPNAATPDEGEPVAMVTTAETGVASQPSAPPGELSQSVSGPAIEVFATAFTGDPSRPMMAIVLEDTLETSLQPLVDLGKPLSFALRSDIDSSESAQSIRQSGYEVLAMLPSGMDRNGDVAGQVAQYMQNVPVAVAVIDANSGGVMLNRDAMQKVLDATRPAGLGVITFAGTGDLVARDQALRAGAPYGNVVQIIDKTADVDLILQALDRAAFDALTRGSSIVFARTKPETIDALVRWTSGAFAQRLQIVPVSVAIQRDTSQ